MTEVKIDMKNYVLSLLMFYLRKENVKFWIKSLNLIKKSFNILMKITPKEYKTNISIILNFLLENYFLALKTMNVQ